MDNFKNKKNKIIQRIISLTLCMALLFSSANILDLFNNISAIEDANDNSNKVITQFSDEIVRDINSIDNVDIYLPSTIRVVYDDGSSDVIDVISWTQIKDCGLNEKTDIHTYYYEAAIDDSYEIDSSTSLPVATVNVVSKPEISFLGDDVISDMGDFFVWINTLENDTAVCSHCFRELDINGLCPDCGTTSEECSCEEIDVDLNNIQSVEAWIAKYSPYHIREDGQFYKVKILFYEDEWWNNLKPNEKELAERIYSAIIYGYKEYNYSIFEIDSTVSEALFFKEHNRSDKTWEEIFSFSPILKITTTEILKEAIEIDPNMTLGSLVSIANKRYISEILDSDFMTNSISGVTDLTEEKMNKIWELGGKFENLQNLTSLQKGRYTVITQTFGRNRYTVTYTADPPTITASGATTTTLGGSAWANDLSKGAFGISHIYRITGPADAAEFPLTFCLNHGKTWEDGDYVYSETNNNRIGGIIKYINENYPNYTSDASHLKAYAVAQQVIWALIGSGQENNNCDSWAEVESRLNNRKTLLGSECVEFAKFLYGSRSTAPSGYASGTIGDGEYQVYRYKLSPSDHQPIAVLTNPVVIEEPSKEPAESEPEENRTRLVVMPQLSSSISGSGTGVIATWKPNGSTQYTPSSLGEMVSPCGSSDNKTWSKDTGTTTTYSASDYAAVGNWYDINEKGEVTGSEPSFETMFPYISSIKSNHYDFNPSTSNKNGVSYQWSQTQVSADSGFSSVSGKKGAYQKNENKVISTHFGVAKQNYSYTTFGSQYCTTETSHNVYKPVVENYTLTLNYQGGWFNGSVNNLSTYDMNSPDYTSVDSFEDTHNAFTHTTSNKVSTETTKVAFSTAENTNTKLLSYRSSITNARSSSSYSWQDKGNYFSFKHSDKAHFDGNTVFVKFKYKNYYVVSLPTPVRTGYNFLGWYTDPENGEKVNPQTVSVNVTTGTYAGVYTTGNATFTNAYVIKANTTLYAHWELITKDETFTIKWLDNYNNYTTRPDAVYVELWRYTSATNAENCKGYISENVTSTTSMQTNWCGGRNITTDRFTPDTNDWVHNLSNETSGKTVTKPSTHDPNATFANGTANSYNNIFYYNDVANSAQRYVIKVDLKGIDSGDNKNPADSNTWTFTLKDLQKYDTYNKNWNEYTYVIREVICESLDRTTYYYTSPKDENNTYSKPMSEYYNLKSDGNMRGSSSNKTLSEYYALPIKTSFSKVAVNRIGNSVMGINPWKSVVVQIHYNDASDKYHFRPYSLKVQLYQNLANYKNTSSENYLDKSGVRILYRTENAQMNSGYAYSSINRVGFDNGIGRNWFFVRFEDLPTVEDSTGIKIAYDAVLTYGQSRYRYTIDDTDEYNNLGQSIKNYGSNHYYSIKHQTNIQSIIDLDYTYMRKDNQFVAILPITKDKYIASAGRWLSQMTAINKSEVQSKKAAGWYFEPDNMNDIFQAANGINSGSLLKNDYDDTSYNIDVANQIIKYNDGKRGYASAFSSEYKSMAYNLRYYYITENNEMTSVSNYIKMPIGVSDAKKIEYLFYTETLHWTFNVDLNGSSLTISPTEYSGSNSSDDRTGNYNGSVDDDYSHTNNKLTITSNVKNQSGAHIDAEDTAYKNLQIDQNQEAFLITLKQIKKNWTGSSDSTGESYTNNNYPANGYIYYNYDSSRNRLTRIFQPEAEAPTGTGYTAVGNEYNIYVPANGSTTLEYLPDGKYEVTCHYDIDFSNFTFAVTTGKTASIVKESNGKYYLTFSSTTVEDNQDITHSATIDYWRGYVDDMNNFSWARPLRDNNFGLVSGTPSNVRDKTLYPFGNGDEKNAVYYRTSTIKNVPNSYSVYEYNGNMNKYANRCPIHGTILTNGKCTNSDCAYSIYQYYSNGSNIVDDKLPYNVYSQYKGIEKNTLK